MSTSTYVLFRNEKTISFFRLKNSTLSGAMKLTPKNIEIFYILHQSQHKMEKNMFSHLISSISI